MTARRTLVTPPVLTRIRPLDAPSHRSLSGRRSFVCAVGLLLAAMVPGLAQAAIITTGTAFSGTINGNDTVVLIDPDGSIDGAVMNEGTLEFSRTSAVSVSDQISGAGNVLITNTGTVTFSGSNSYLGGTTIRFGGLVLASGGSIGHPSSDIVVGDANGDSGTLTVSGGTASIRKLYQGYADGSTGSTAVTSGTLGVSDEFFVGYSGTGTLALSGGTIAAGSSFFLGQNEGSSGSATVTGGALTVASALEVGHSGTGDLTISGGHVTSGSGLIGLNSTSGGTVTVTSSGTWAVLGNLIVGYDGSGSLTIGSGGVVSVGDTLSRSVTSGTIGLDAGGTLLIGTGGTGGTLATDLTNNGLVIFNRSDDSTYGFAMDGSGTVVKRGAGKLSFTGNNSYTGGTTIEDGVLEVYGGSIAHAAAAVAIGDAGGNVGQFDVAGGTVTASSIDVVRGAFDLSAGLVSSGSAAIRTGTASISGGEWAVANDLFVGSSGTGRLFVSDGLVTNTNATIGNAAGEVGSATVTGGVWRNYGDLVVGGTVGGGGTGTLTISGVGIVAVEGTLSRGTAGTINLNAGGTLQIGSGGTTGLLNTNLTNDGLVVFNRSTASVYSYVMSGTGGVRKLGTGALTLSATSSYTGSTAVDEGTLYVNGELGDTAVAVNAGAVLGGVGRVLGEVSINTAGTFSPGSLTQAYASFGVGGLSLAAGSLTQLTISGTQAGIDYDQIVGIDGTESINYGGELAINLNGQYADYTTFHLFANFTGRVGDFDAITLSGTNDFTGGFTLESPGLWVTAWTTGKQRLEFNTATGDLVVVPEPSAIVIAAGAGLAGFWRWRKRRSSRRPVSTAAS